MTNLQTPSSNEITKLPNFLIDQIKAGEVIERPAHAIKEILENAIDAEATCINLHIIENGLELISCRDNGKGINFQQLPNAFTRHSTSKISRFEDIYSLSTFGFRGEALASVAAISKITCSSAPRNNKADGGKISLEGGHQTSYFPYDSLEEGTNLVIENLFFNTPARLKFIRSKTSEKNSIQKIISAFLLSNPHVEFNIKWDDKEAIHYESTRENQTRVQQVLNKRNRKDFSLNKLEGEYDGHQITLYFSELSSRGGQGKNHFLFVNNRLFQDKSIHHQIIKSLARIWGEGQSGDYCLVIHAPPDKIDVNVHPNKTYIKFESPGIIHSLITSIIGNYKENHQLKSADELPQSEESYFSETVEKLTPTSSPKPTDFQVRKFSEQVAIVENEFLFYKSEKGQLHLINYISLLENFFKKHFDLDQFTTKPLLIAEPISINISSSILSHLNNRGFEVDLLNNELYVLRAIPDWLLPIGPFPYIEYIIHFLSDQLNVTSLDSISSVSKQHLDHIVNSDPDFIKRDYQRVLSHEDLKSLLTHD